MHKTVRKVWLFASDSSSREDQTLQYQDRSTSCNCPGWTKRVAGDGSRSCKHTRLVDLGQADRSAISVKDYGKSELRRPEPTTLIPSPAGRAFDFAA